MKRLKVKKLPTILKAQSRLLWQIAAGLPGPKWAINRRIIDMTPYIAIKPRNTMCFKPAVAGRISALALNIVDLGRIQQNWRAD